MPINVELLQKTLDHIEEHPEEWDQDKWRCETTMCFAGHAVTIGGLEWADTDDIDAGTDAVIHPDGGVWDVEYAATELLGLTDDQADSLFYAQTNIEYMRERVAELIAIGEKQKAATS